MLDTGRFLDRAQVHLDYFEAMKLSGHRVTSIKNYLTGKEISKGVYSVSLYSVGQDLAMAQLFNIKLNIYRGEASPLLIGLQDRDLVDYGNTAEDFDTTWDITPFTRDSARSKQIKARNTEKKATITKKKAHNAQKKSKD